MAISSCNKTVDKVSAELLENQLLSLLQRWPYVEGSGLTLAGAGSHFQVGWLTQQTPCSAASYSQASRCNSLPLHGWQTLTEVLSLSRHLSDEIRSTQD